MKNILVVKRLNIFTIFIVIIYKFFKFEVYIFEYSKKIVNWRLLKFLSLQECNFEECIDIDLNRYGGKIGDAIDKITNEWVDNELLDNFSPFFTNVKDPNIKNQLLIKEYVLNRCVTLNNICIWIDGYFVNHKKDNLKIYLLGDVCRVGERFLAIHFNDLKVKPIFSSNFFIVSGVALKVFSVLYGKIFTIIDRVTTTKCSDISQPSFISNNIDTLLYKVLYFPHKSIFYGDLFIKDSFYSKGIDSAFYPSNILHIELENITISDNQSKYYIDNNIATTILPKVKIKKLYNFLIYILGEIGLKRSLFFIRKDFILFFIFLFYGAKFLSTKELIKENYNAKLVLVGYDILFSLTLSLVFESLKIRTIAIQERFLPIFFSHYPSLIDTYLCGSEFVCKTIEKSNNKFVKNCIPCGQIRSDTLINYQKNITSKNERLTIAAFDFHSDCDFNNNRRNVLINWKANASFYNDLCKLAKRFPEVDIIIRGKNTDWTKISYFKNVLNKVNRIPNIWIDEDYSKLNKQYELVSRSDLIIAKPTSIGDEAMAAGKRVVYYDYIPNSSNYFASGYFNYNNCNIFAYSYTQLKQMVQTIVNGGELLTDDEVLELQVITNNMPADGNVKSRVMKNLDIIYNQVYL